MYAISDSVCTPCEREREREKREREASRPSPMQQIPPSPQLVASAPPTRFPRHKIRILLLENVHQCAIDNFHKEGFYVETAVAISEQASASSRSLPLPPSLPPFHLLFLPPFLLPFSSSHPPAPLSFPLPTYSLYALSV